MQEKSILIRDEQHEWLTNGSNYINLSAFVRAQLDELMAQQDAAEEVTP